MRDPRIVQFAEVLVDYSTRVKKGDVVLINAAGLEAAPLVKELHALCLKRGARYVEYTFSVPEIDRTFYNLATKQQLAYFPQHKLDFFKTVTVYIGIAAGNNSMVMANARQDAMVAYQKVVKPLIDQRVKHTRWVVTRFPTHAAAQEARMSLDEYEDYLFSACCIDWVKESRKQDKLKKLMDRTDQVRIVAPDTDLRFSIAGLPGIKCDGRLNMPDGEVFSAPVKDSVQGHITYNCPSIYQGKEFNAVHFKFKDGRIVEATADGGMTGPLNKILDTDAGARYIGEFSLGINPGIRQPMRNILFDEKIFGSIHFTPGEAYDECDNGNRSAVHWDLVRLLTDGGEIWFDGVLIQKNGLFVHKDLLELNPL
ncbi:aminopeptidase [Geobacter sp. SVR]|uniref:aminopeptidase n=1 Tax=Geobacter sp. SVR TaxID=2495594 RepID=UPI00143EFC4C|nr:aminopeptidase [Geobacter sp. SVR]BCS53752.1 aminopeptidase [Geobacter sp. SVR]GCF85739.1 aminopeptidase [Geobacter sp. SVR]